MIRGGEEQSGTLEVAIHGRIKPEGMGGPLDLEELFKKTPTTCSVTSSEDEVNSLLKAQVTVKMVDVLETIRELHTFIVMNP